MYEFTGMRDPSCAQREKTVTNMFDAASELVSIGLKSFSDSLNAINRISDINKKPGKTRTCHCCDCMDTHQWLDCLPCGQQISSTDLSLTARMGERRRLSIVLENNKSGSVAYAIQIENLMDACGNVISNDQLFQISPPKGVIATCACVRIDLFINLEAPLQAGQVYYADIKLSGDCGCNSVSLGIWVEPEGIADFLALCDHCRPRKGKFVEFHNCDCGCCSEGRKYYLCNEHTGTSAAPRT